MPPWSGTFSCRSRSTWACSWPGSRPNGGARSGCARSAPDQRPVRAVDRHLSGRLRLPRSRNHPVPRHPHRRARTRAHAARSPAHRHLGPVHPPAGTQRGPGARSADPRPQHLQHGRGAGRGNPCLHDPEQHSRLGRTVSYSLRSVVLTRTCSVWLFVRKLN